MVHPDSQVKIIALLRSRDRNLRSWIERVEVKYNDVKKRTQGEPKVDPSFLLKLRQYHKNLRNAILDRYQDQLIFKDFRKEERKKKVTTLLQRVGIKKSEEKQKGTTPKDKISKKSILVSKYPIKKIKPIKSKSSSKKEKKK